DAGREQAGQAVEAQPARLVRAAADAVGAGALGQPRHAQTALAERDDVLRLLLRRRGVEMVRESAEPQQRSPRRHRAVPNEIAPVHGNLLRSSAPRDNTSTTGKSRRGPKARRPVADGQREARMKEGGRSPAAKKI